MGRLVVSQFITDPNEKLDGRKGRINNNAKGRKGSSSTLTSHFTLLEHFTMGEENKKLCACCTFIITITSMVLFICSFHYVGELSYCLRFERNSKVMADTVEDTPGTFFLGVAGGFMCFPKTRQQLEFSVRSARR